MKEHSYFEGVQGCKNMQETGKGHLISKAIYGLLTSPKKQMDEFDFFPDDLEILET